VVSAVVTMVVIMAVMKAVKVVKMVKVVKVVKEVKVMEVCEGAGRWSAAGIHRGIPPLRIRTQWHAWRHAWCTVESLLGQFE